MDAFEEPILPPSPEPASADLPSLLPPTPTKQASPPPAPVMRRRSARFALPTPSPSPAKPQPSADASGCASLPAGGRKAEDKGAETRRLRRGKENIPPLHDASMTSAAVTGGPSGTRRQDEVEMDAEDELIMPPTPTRATRATAAAQGRQSPGLKRSRTPSMLDLSSGRRKLVRSESSASSHSSFSSSLSSPPVPTTPAAARVAKEETVVITPERTPTRQPSVYAKARALLRCSSSTLTTSLAATGLDTSLAAVDEATLGGGALIGRSAEYTEILDFLASASSAPPARSTRTGKAREQPSAHPRTMYISGPPGTGKTALLSRLADQQRAQRTTVGVVNCFTAAQGAGGREVWERVGEELFDKAWVRGAGREGVIQGLIEAEDRKFILILDELDSLVSVPTSSSSPSSASPANPSVLSPSLLLLQTLFLLPTSVPTSNLALLAISNTLDFATRYLASLPRPPKTLAFAAYDAAQMGAIILDRLASLIDEKGARAVVVEDKAVELAARKVMAENGDLRLCLDVVRLAVEIAEGEWRRACLAKMPPVTPSKSGRRTEAALSAAASEAVPLKKAGMAHVLKALQKAKAVACPSSSSAAASSLAVGGAGTVAGLKTPTKKAVNAGTVQKIQALNIQSRLILVALVIHSRRSSLGLPPLATASASAGSPAKPTASSSSGGERTTSGALLSTYLHLLSSSDSPVHALSPSDFHTLLALLADAALLSLAQPTPSKRRGGGSTPASAVVQLSCLEDEVVKGLVGTGGGGAEEEEARRILEREETRMERLKAKLGRERKAEKECPVEDRL